MVEDDLNSCQNSALESLSIYSSIFYPQITINNLSLNILNNFIIFLKPHTDVGKCNSNLLSFDIRVSWLTCKTEGKEPQNIQTNKSQINKEKEPCYFYLRKLSRVFFPPMQLCIFFPLNMCHVTYLLISAKILRRELRKSNSLKKIFSLNIACYGP